MAVVVAAPVEIGLDAEAGRGGAGGEMPLEVAGNEVVPPVEVGGEGVLPPVEVDEKRAPPVEGVPVAVTARGEKEKVKEEKEKGEEAVEPAAAEPPKPKEVAMAGAAVIWARF